MKLVASVAVAAILLAASPLTHAQQGQSQRQQPNGQGQMSQEEARLRMMLLQRSMGFGGIFRPGLDEWRRGSPTKSAAPDRCSRYNDNAARQACRSGDGWAADRLQNRRSNGSERAWYNR